MPKRAFVFGISGATWDVAGPLIAAGKLPNLRRLRDGGCHGTMLSVRAEGDKHYRPQIAWVTLATGRGPEVHGVNRFYHTADDCRCPSFWDSFLASGRNIGLFGWPMTWPPKPVNGFLIPCYHGRDDRTWPSELAAIKSLDRQRHESSRDREAGSKPSASELLRMGATLVRNGVGVRSWPFLGVSAARALMNRDSQLRSLILRHAKTEVDADIFLHLYREHRPQLSSFHSFLVDQISHRFWRYHDPLLFGELMKGHRCALKTAVEDAYARTDRVLGRILRALEPDTVVAVVSEHGMAAEPSSAEAGPWQYMIRGRALAALVGLGHGLIACPIARWIAYRPRGGGAMPVGAAARFQAISVVETGRPLFHVYEHGQDEVIVKFDISADVARYRQGELENLHIDVGGRRVAFNEIARRGARQRSAMHDQKGIFMMSGSNIRRGATIPDCRLVDFAPTLLKAVHLEQPEHMEGDILDVFVGRR